LASSKGQMIRIPLSSVKKLQRDTQGVILVRMNDGDKVTSVTVISKDKEEKLAESVPAETSPPAETSSVETPPDEEKEPPAQNNLEPETPEEVVAEKVTTKKAVTKEKEKTSDKVPAWAKVHSDEVKAAKKTVTKIPKEIKVHNYQEKKPPKPASLPKEQAQKELKLNLKKDESDEPNYWGGKLNI
jgi:DNA gyrase/topoisomerase IV subunit A